MNSSRIPGTLLGIQELLQDPFKISGVFPERFKGFRIFSRDPRTLFQEHKRVFRDSKNFPGTFLGTQQHYFHSHKRNLVQVLVSGLEKTYFQRFDLITGSGSSKVFLLLGEMKTLVLSKRVYTETRIQTESKFSLKKV